MDPTVIIKQEPGDKEENDIQEKTLVNPSSGIKPLLQIDGASSERFNTTMSNDIHNTHPHAEKKDKSGSPVHQIDNIKEGNAVSNESELEDPLYFNFVEIKQEKEDNCSDYNNLTGSNGVIDDEIEREKGLNYDEADVSPNNPICSDELLNKDERDSGSKKFNCPNCDFQANNLLSIRRHVERYCSEKKYSCDQCKFKTNYKSILNTHALDHLGIKRFSCEQCSYKTNSAGNFKTHMQNHAVVKRFSCQHCDFKTNYKRTLKNHVLEHIDI